MIEKRPSDPYNASSAALRKEWSVQFSSATFVQFTPAANNGTLWSSGRGGLKRGARCRYARSGSAIHGSASTRYRQPAAAVVSGAAVLAHLPRGPYAERRQAPGGAGGGGCLLVAVIILGAPSQQAARAALVATGHVSGVSVAFSGGRGLPVLAPRKRYGGPARLHGCVFAIASQRYAL